MKKKLKITVVLISIIGSLLIQPIFSSSDAKSELQNGLENIIKILANHKSRATKKKLIRVIYDKRFDRDGFARVTLKRMWKQLNKAQQQEFTSLYADFIFNYYFSKLKSYNNNEIKYGKTITKRKGKIAQVYTKVKYKQSWAEVIYSLRIKSDKWRIYDAQIEGIRLSSTFRSQFERVMSKTKYAGLKKEIQKLIKKYK